MATQRQAWDCAVPCHVSLWSIDHFPKERNGIDLFSGEGEVSETLSISGGQELWTARDVDLRDRLLSDLLPPWS